MSSPAPIEIEKDLVRWRGRKWVVVVLVALTAEGLFLLKAPTPVVPASRVPAPQTSVKFARQGATSSEFVQVQDPTLFAGANIHGFSGRAWIIQPPWRAPAIGPLPPPAYLSFREAATVHEPLPESATLPEVARARAEPSAVQAETEPIAAGSRASRVTVEGMRSRPLASMPAVPLQYATDALRPSVVQIFVDPDGSVFSTRLLSSSGSKAADNDALRISRGSTFAPAEETAPGRLKSGKIVFEWYALDPGMTNGSAR